MSAAEAARCSVIWNKLRFNEEEFAICAQNAMKLLDEHKDGYLVEIGEGVTCRAGNSSFWVTWAGKMLPRGMMRCMCSGMFYRNRTI